MRLNWKEYLKQAGLAGLRGAIAFLAARFINVDLGLLEPFRYYIAYAALAFWVWLRNKVPGL